MFGDMVCCCKSMMRFLTLVHHVDDIFRNVKMVKSLLKYYTFSSLIQLNAWCCCM